MDDQHKGMLLVGVVVLVGVILYYELRDRLAPVSTEAKPIASAAPSTNGKPATAPKPAKESAA